MPRAVLSNLTAGILSNKLLGRADLARFQNACLRLENYQIDPTGEWGARQAMVFCGKRKFADKVSIPIDFNFGVKQAYILEFGHQYMRVWMNGGQVLTAPGGPVFEIATPYSESDLATLWWMQSADVLYILHASHQPRQLVRTDHNAWAISVFETNGPYQKEVNKSGWKLTASAASGGGVIVNAVGSGHTPFVAGRENQLIAWKNSADEWTWLRIDQINSTTQVVCTVRGENLAAGLETATYRLGVYWNGNWPSTGRLIEGRLLLGGADSARDRTDGSANSDYPTFMPGTNDADPFAWTLASEQVDKIQAYASVGELIVITAGSFWRMSGQTERSAITPNSVSAKKLAGHGAANIRPAEVSDALLVIDRSKRKVLRMQLNPDGLQSWAVTDLTVLSDNIAGRRRDATGFTGLAWQPSPKPTVWAPRKDGQLPALTYLPEEKVLAWQLVVTWPGDVIEHVKVIPEGDGIYRLYLFVLRYIAGQPVRTVEVLEWDNLLRSPAEEKRLDCCLTYNAPVAQTLTFGALDGDGVLATASGNVFASGDVGREIRACLEERIDDDDEVIWRWCVARITEYITAKTVRVKILAPLLSTVLAAGTWRLTVTEVSGVELYEGEEVSAQIDGQPVHGLKVQNGKVQLGRHGSIIHIGRRYRARGLTMPLDTGSPPGSGQGRKARVDRIMVRVRESIGGRIASWHKGKEPRWARLGLPTWNWEAAKPPLPMSYDVTVNVTGGWTTRPMILFEQDEPLPHNVQLVNPNIYAPWVDV